MQLMHEGREDLTENALDDGEHEREVEKLSKQVEKLSKDHTAMQESLHMMQNSLGNCVN